jgi:type IV pilus assembly protein PilM
MLIVIPNDIIAKYKKIFEWAGLKLEALEMESLALIRSVIKPEEGVIMAVDFGAESTAITIADNSRLEFVNQIDYGGSYLTKAISRSLELSERRAEELKKSRGLLARGADSELSTLTLPFLDVIIREVERTKETYEEKYKKSIQKVMCVGGGANLLGLEEYVGKQLHLPVIQAKPLVGVEYPLQIEPIVHQLQNNFAVSIGLAKRYYIQ